MIKNNLNKLIIEKIYQLNINKMIYKDKRLNNNKLDFY